MSEYIGEIEQEARPRDWLVGPGPGGHADGMNLREWKMYGMPTRNARTDVDVNVYQDRSSCG
jgi:hypothetical protein